jgi:hypothetical protein
MDWLGGLGQSRQIDSDRVTHYNFTEYDFARQVRVSRAGPASGPGWPWPGGVVRAGCH